MSRRGGDDDDDDDGQLGLFGSDSDRDPPDSDSDSDIPGADPPASDPPSEGPMPRARPGLPIDPATAPQMSVAEARAWLRDNCGRSTNNGAKCPCCTQFVKVYKRKLNTSMATSLGHIFRFYARGTKEWLHVPTYLRDRRVNGNNDVGLLRHWGILEENDEPARADGGSWNGFYRLTDLGRRFVTGQCSVPKYVFLFDERLLGVTDDILTTFDEALGERFDYEELMNA